MMLQRGGCVHGSQWCTLRSHPFVILASMVQIVTQARHVQSYSL